MYIFFFSSLFTQQSQQKATKIHFLNNLIPRSQVPKQLGTQTVNKYHLVVPSLSTIKTYHLVVPSISAIPSVPFFFLFFLFFFFLY